MRAPMLLVLLALAVGGLLWWALADEGQDARLVSDEARTTDESAAALRGTDGPALRVDGATKAKGDDPWLRWFEEHAPPRGATSGHVGGTVFDENTRVAIAGAHVLLLFSASLGYDGATRSTRSDAQGRFRFESVPRGSWILIASHSAYLDARVHAVVGADAAARVKLTASCLVHVPAQAGVEHLRELPMRPAKPRVGRVVDENGDPVSGAKIVIDASYSRLERVFGVPVDVDEEQPVAVSDGEGRFELPCLPKGLLPDASIAAYTDRHAGVVAEDQDPGDPSKDLLLEVRRFARLAGRVRYDDGSPAGGLTIYVSEEMVSGERDSPTTDAEGRFDIATVAPGDEVELDFYRVEPWAELADHMVGALTPGEQREGLEIRIPRERAARGRLIDASGKGVARAGVVLRIDQEGSEVHGDWVDHQETNEDGTFTIAAAGAHAVMLIHATPNQEVILARGLKLPADGLEFTVERAQGTIVRVRATAPDGSAIPRFRLSGSVEQLDWEGDTSEQEARETVTDHGVAELEMPGRPPWILEVHGARDAEDLPLPLGRGSLRLEAVPTGPVTIPVLGVQSTRFVFIDELGAAVEGVKPSVDEDNGVLEAKGPGEFIVTATRPGAGSYMLQVEVPTPFVPLGGIWASHGDSEYRIVLRRGVGIRGRLEAMEPIPPAVLKAMSIDVEWAPGGDGDSGWETYDITVKPGADGSFSVPGVPADARVRIEVLDRGTYYQAAPATCMAGDENVIVKLVRGLELTVRLKGLAEAGLKPSDLLVGIVRSGHVGDEYEELEPDADGVVVLRGLRPGPHEVFVEGSHGPLPLLRRGGVQPGGELTLTLPALANLRGRIHGTRAKNESWAILAWGASAGVRGLFGSGAEIEEDGSFELKGVDATDRFHLLAVAYDENEGRTLRVALVTDIAPGGNPARFDLQPALSIRGRVEGAEEDEAFVFIARARTHQIWTYADRVFELSGLVDGQRYDVLVIGQDGKEWVVAKGVAAGAIGLVVKAPK